MLGFSEKEIRHMTYKKWNQLFEYYKRFYNFKLNQNLFQVEKTEEEIYESYEWFKD